MSELFEQVGVAYVVDVEKVFPDLLKRTNEQFHAMLESLEDALMDAEGAKELEDGVGVFGIYTLTMEGTPQQTARTLEKTIAKVVTKWNRRKARYETEAA